MVLHLEDAAAMVEDVAEAAHPRHKHKMMLPSMATYLLQPVWTLLEVVAVVAGEEEVVEMAGAAVEAKEQSATRALVLQSVITRWMHSATGSLTELCCHKRCLGQNGVFSTIFSFCV